MNGAQGLGVVHKLFTVEPVVLLVGHILLGPLPQRDHGVEGVNLHITFILRLVLGGFLFLPGFADLHTDGVADIVGVLFHQLADLIFLQELGEGVLLGVGLQLHDHISTGVFTLIFCDGVAVGAVGDPFPSGVLTVLLGNDGDLLCHHKGRVETNAELTDDVDVLTFLHLLLKAQRAGFADGAEVFFHFILAHTDAVVGHGQGLSLFVTDDGDGKLFPVDAHLIVGEGGVGQLVDGVRRIGQNLS